MPSAVQYILFEKKTGYILKQCSVSAMGVFIVVNFIQCFSGSVAGGV